MILPEFLQRGPLGEIRFAGNRIDLYFVVAAFRKGAAVEQVAAQYSTVGPVLVRSAIEFYRQNRAAVDAYVQSVEAEIAHNLATIAHVDAESLRKRHADSPCRS